MGGSPQELIGAWTRSRRPFLILKIQGTGAVAIGEHAEPIADIMPCAVQHPFAKALAGDHALFDQGFFQALLFFLGK